MNKKIQFAYHDAVGHLCGRHLCARCAIALCLRMARRAGRIIERRGRHQYAIFYGGMNIRIIEGVVS